MEIQKTKVFIVDDFAPMRASLRKLLDLEQDFQVCGEAGDVESAFEGIQATHPDVTILDLVLGRQTGLDLLKLLGKTLETLPVLVLSMLPESLNIETVLEKGARGYIMKSESPDQILTALRQVAEGKIYISPSMMHQRSKKEDNSHE